MSNNNSDLSTNTNVVKLTQAELNSVTGGIVTPPREKYGWRSRILFPFPPIVVH
jgi:hypothetical protein